MWYWSKIGLLCAAHIRMDRKHLGFNAAHVHAALDPEEACHDLVIPSTLKLTDTYRSCPSLYPMNWHRSNTARMLARSSRIYRGHLCAGAHTPAQDFDTMAAQIVAALLDIDATLVIHEVVVNIKACLHRSCNTNRE